MFHSAVNMLHSHFVYSRRVQIIAKHLSDLLPRDASVLDVGTGDGLIVSLVQSLRPDLKIIGVDVLQRAKTYIPVTWFDGITLPFADKQFDTITFVDVLHHADNALDLLREAARLARVAIVIKDHLREGILADTTLRFMDWVGNRRYGVALPYNYWQRRQWHTAFRAAGLEQEYWFESLRLYSWPLDALFGRKLHFIARLAASSSVERTMLHAEVKQDT